VSISRFREMMNNKGCQIPMLVVGGLLLVGFVASGFAPGLFQSAGGNPEEKPVAMVGKVPVTAKFLDSIVTKSTRNYPPEFVSQPEVSAMVYQGAISQATMMAAVQDLAEERGIKLDDKTIKTEFEKNLDTEIDQYVSQMKSQGQLKPDATAADIDAAFKKSFGGDRKFLKEQAVEDMSANLALPGMRLLAVTPVLQKRLLEDEKKGVSYSEDELKKSFDNFTFDVVKFNKKDAKPDEVKANADKGLADLKAGKTPEEVRAAFGKPLEKDEKPTQVMSRAALEFDPDSKTLLAMKVGDISPVMNQFGETKVLKLLSIENKLPADFETTKAKLIDQKKQSLAEKKLVEELRKRSEAAKWNSAGLGALAEWAATTTNEKMAADPAKRAEAVEKLYAKLASVKDENPVGRKALALASFAATSDLYQAAKNPVDKTKWGKAKLEAYKACFEYGDSAESRLNASDLAVEVADKDALAENLLEAARINTQFTQQGAQLQARTGALLQKTKTANLVTPETEKAVQKELDAWVANKTEFEKDQAEAAKEKAAAESKMGDQQAKLKEEEQKALEKEKAAAAPAPAPKAAPSPVPGIPGVGGGK